MSDGRIPTRWRPFFEPPPNSSTPFLMLNPMTSYPDKELIQSFSTLEEMVKAIDVSAFPLPVRLDLSAQCETPFCTCSRTVIAFMKVKPRNAAELRDGSRDENGLVELNARMKPSECDIKQLGPCVVLNNIRSHLGFLVMHEFYESFRLAGHLIFDPHDFTRKPTGQPF